MALLWINLESFSYSSSSVLPFFISSISGAHNVQHLAWGALTTICRLVLCPTWFTSVPFSIYLCTRPYDGPISSSRPCLFSREVGWYVCTAVWEGSPFCWASDFNLTDRRVYTHDCRLLSGRLLTETHVRSVVGCNVPHVRGIISTDLMLSGRLFSDANHLKLPQVIIKAH